MLQLSTTHAPAVQGGAQRPIVWFHRIIKGERRQRGVQTRHKCRARLVAMKTGKHELGAVADGVNGAVLHDHTLVAGEERLEGRDDSVDTRAGLS